MTAITIPADSELGQRMLREIQSQQARETLEVRREQAARREAAIKAIEIGRPKWIAKREAAEKAVADAEAKLAQARIDLHNTMQGIQAESWPHDRARDLSEAYLRRTTPEAIKAFRDEMRQLQATTGFHEEYGRDEKTQKQIRRNNADAVARRAEAIKAAICACQDLELCALSDTELEKELEKLRATTRVPTNVFGQWFRSMFG